MRIYQLHISIDGESRGSGFYATREAAKRGAARMQKAGFETSITQSDFPVTKAGFLNALNRLANHPDNG